MRVVMEYDNAPTACESSNDFGETEDYCVTIGEAGPTCDAPTGISTSGVGDNSATVSWSAATGATSYNIQYKPTSSGVWSSTTSNTTSIALSGLANCTEHEVQIQTVCASGTSSFSSSTTFTTTGCAPSCGTPTSLSASNLTPNSADITWFDVAGATNYNVRYKESAAGSWTTTTSNSNSMTLTGLNTCTAYDFEVQADCSGTTGSFSNTANFTTTGCSGGSGCVTYCASSGDSVDEWIEDITIGLSLIHI